MARKTVVSETVEVAPEVVKKNKGGRPKKTPVAQAPQFDAQILANAIVQASRDAAEAHKPFVKKSLLDYVEKTPWTPPKGVLKSKLKRKMFIHSLAVDPDLLYNEEIDLLNKIRPGDYCNNFIHVQRRRDKGLNITWPVKTKADHMKLATVYKITSLTDLCNKVIAEAAAPKVDAYATADDDL